MLKTSHRAVAFVALAFACMLTACDDAPPEGQQSAPAAEQKARPQEVASVGKDMVAAVSSGKSASVIGVHFALRAPPTVDKALPVDVTIVPHRKFSLVRVHFESRDGLTMPSGGVFGPTSDVASEKALSHQLVLFPTKEGIFMVTASVETESEEGNVTRVFSIPVIVSAEPTPVAPAAPATAAENPAAGS